MRNMLTLRSLPRQLRSAHGLPRRSKLNKRTTSQSEKTIRSKHTTTKTTITSSLEGPRRIKPKLLNCTDTSLKHK